MAVKAAVSMRLDVTIGNQVVPWVPTRVEWTLTEDDLQEGIWEVSTSEEDLGVGDVTTEGLLVLHNLEASGGNDLIWGPKSGASMVAAGRVYPGRTASFEMDPGVTIRAKSSSGTIRVYYKLLSK